MGKTVRQLQISQRTALTVLILLGLVSSVEATIYKWVDAEGRTHYSERKEDAGKAKPVDLKLGSQPRPSTAPESERPRQPSQPQVPRFVENAYVPVAKPAPRSISGGRSDDTDASRCTLAREVLSGAVRHPNGAPTDDYDRSIAQNDIRSYCR